MDTQMTPSHKDSGIFRESFITDKMDLNDEVVPMNNIATNRELI